MTHNDQDSVEKVNKLKKAGKLVPPKLGPDGQPVARTPQEQKTEEIYQRDILDEPFKTPIGAFRNLGNLKFEDAGAGLGVGPAGTA